MRLNRKNTATTEAVQPEQSKVMGFTPIEPEISINDLYPTMESTSENIDGLVSMGVESLDYLDTSDMPSDVYLEDHLVEEAMMPVLDEIPEETKEEKKEGKKMTLAERLQQINRDNQTIMDMITEQLVSAATTDNATEATVRVEKSQLSFVDKFLKENDFSNIEKHEEKESVTYTIHW